MSSLDTTSVIGAITDSLEDSVIGSIPESLEDSGIDSQITETVERFDINNDGRIDVVTTVTEKIDVDFDGKVDLIKKTVTGVDEINKDINHFKSELDSANLDVNLSNIVDVIESGSESARLLQEIEVLQGQIKCSKSQHLGTMSDYSKLFSKYQQFVQEAGDSSIELNLDTSELSKFAEEAEKFSAIFEDVSMRFQRLSVVDDTSMLKKVKAELSRISLMYDNIRKFRATISSTSVLQVPLTVVKVADQLQLVSESIDCSLNFLNRFVDGEFVLTPEQEELAALDEKDRAAIVAAERALDVWLDMIKNEANVTMSSNALIKQFRERLGVFGEKADNLKSLTDKLSSRFAQWRTGNFL